MTQITTAEMLNNITLCDLIGVPYKPNGRDLTGLDCYGLTILAVYIITGKRIKDIVYENHNKELADKFAPTLNVKETTEIKPGNVIEMTFTYNNDLHLGVIINDREYIHATQNCGVKISPIKNAPIHRIYEVL